jgi:hypothetical protein
MSASRPLQPSGDRKQRPLADGVAKGLIRALLLIHIGSRYVKNARFGTILHIAGPLMASRLLLPTTRSINNVKGSLAEFD